MDIIYFISVKTINYKKICNIMIYNNTTILHTYNLIIIFI